MVHTGRNDDQPLDNRGFCEAPVSSKDLRQMTLAMRHRAREPVPDAIDRIKP